MRNEDTAIRSALENTKDAGSGGSALETSVEEALERPRSILSIALDEAELALGLGDALVLVRQSELGERSSGDEETGRVGGSPVGQAVLDAVLRQLVRVRRGQDDIALDLGVHDLRNDVAVREAHDKAVLW